MKVKECMENDICYLNPENTVWECAKLMSENHIGCVPICDKQNNIVGLVTDRDVILRSIACDKDVKTTPVSEIMTTNVCYCNWETEIKDAEELMSINQIRRLPIVDNNNKMIGIVTLGDLAKNTNVNKSGVTNTLETICKCNDKNAE